MTTLIPGAPPGLVSIERKRVLQTTLAVVYHDGIELGLVQPFISWIKKLDLEIRTLQPFTLTREGAILFLISADSMATSDAARKIRIRYLKEGRDLRADFGTDRVEGISCELYKRVIQYLMRPMVALEIVGINAVERVRHLVEAPKGSTTPCIRKNFPDSFDKANSEGRAFGKRVHAAKDIHEAEGGVDWLHSQLKTSQSLAA